MFLQLGQAVGKQGGKPSSQQKYESMSMLNVGRRNEHDGTQGQNVAVGIGRHPLGDIVWASASRPGSTPARGHRRRLQRRGQVASGRSWIHSKSHIGQPESLLHARHGVTGGLPVAQVMDFRLQARIGEEFSVVNH